MKDDPKYYIYRARRLAGSKTRTQQDYVTTTTAPSIGKVKDQIAAGEFNDIQVGDHVTVVSKVTGFSRPSVFSFTVEDPAPVTLWTLKPVVASAP